MRLERDIVYGQGMGEAGPVPLALDLYWSPDIGRPPRPVILYLHGGGFQGGDKYGDYGGASEKLMIDLASAGFAVLAANYRTTRDAPVAGAAVARLRSALADALSAQFCSECACAEGSERPPPRACLDGAGAYSPGPTRIGLDEYRDGMLSGRFAAAMASAVEDAAAVLNWVHAEGRARGLDAERVVLLGASAGAVTANLLAYAADDLVEPPAPRPAGVVSISGGLAGLERLVDADDPPALLVHAIGDPYVGVAASDRLAAALAGRGVTHLYARLDGAGHSLATIPVFRTRWESATLAERIRAFAEEVSQRGNAP
ncbi:MAG: alpha/beta hydrolase fold domain-containing protein [Alphaproteobacteria bacterium]|nr:alpha/beta hydrolase fold domain-containing protein [Alphaproteobacteria bacterium]